MNDVRGAVGRIAPRFVRLQATEMNSLPHAYCISPVERFMVIQRVPLCGRMTSPLICAG